jgi:hypothetical protein
MDIDFYWIHLFKEFKPCLPSWLWLFFYFQFELIFKTTCDFALESLYFLVGSFFFLPLIFFNLALFVFKNPWSSFARLLFNLNSVMSNMERISWNLPEVHSLFSTLGRYQHKKGFWHLTCSIDLQSYLPHLISVYYLMIYF